MDVSCAENSTSSMLHRSERKLYRQQGHERRRKRSKRIRASAGRLREALQRRDRKSGGQSVRQTKGRRGLTKKEAEMETRRFGRTGHMSTVAIFGAAAFWEISQEDADKVMELVIEAGINHIDVAPSYGQAEIRIGPWMPRERGRFFLGCKTMERTKEGAWKEMQDIPQTPANRDVRSVPVPRDHNDGGTGRDHDEGRRAGSVRGGASGRINQIYRDHRSRGGCSEDLSRSVEAFRFRFHYVPAEFRPDGKSRIQKICRRTDRHLQSKRCRHDGHQDHHEGSLGRESSTPPRPGTSRSTKAMKSSGR